MRALLALGLISLLLAGCGGGGSTTETGPSGGDVDWPHWGNTPENTHYAELDQIDTGNVAKLQLAWSRPEGAGQFAWETFPIVVGRTMFYDTGTDEVFAVDGATGKVRWTYTPQINFLAGPQLETSEPVSRGVTYGAGRIYLTTADDKLIALDAHTGKKIWGTQVVDPAEGWAESSTGLHYRFVTYRRAEAAGSG